MLRLRDDQVLEAVRRGDAQTLRKHLESGGDANLRDSSGQLTLLQLAAQKGDLETVSVLIGCQLCRPNEQSSKNGDTALIIAVKGGHASVCRRLILLGDCDLSAQNSEGFTALMKAAKRGMVSTVLLLLQHGADPEVASRQGGHTALTLAIVHLKLKTVELLLQFGASLEHTIAGGKTPLDIAWELQPEGPDSSRRQEIIEKMVETRNLREGIKRDTGFSTDVLNGQYKIVETIGSGTFGSVFLTDNLRSRTSDSRVVVKAMRPRSNRRTVEIQREGLHEAKLMARIESPQVVKIIQYFRVGKSFCIAMEFCEFGDQDAWIQAMKKKHRQLPCDTVMHWFLQSLLALSYLHGNRILHRDLKPKNIFLKQDGTAKIGDFGLSRRLMGSEECASTVAGTVAYMCPEILRNVSRPALDIAEVPVEGYDAKCDIWSLGCSLYELCACRLLFDVDNIKEVVCGSSEIPKLPSKYPGELNALFQQMMARQRKSRASCEQLLATQAVRAALARMREDGCAADAKFLHENCQLLKITGLPDHRASTVDDDEDTLTFQRGGNDLLWRAVNSVLENKPAELVSPNYDLRDGSISDTVPDSIVEALAEQLTFGFPLEQIYRRALLSLDQPAEVRRAEYAKFTDELDICERLELLVVCEMTK